jgi:hypothetical protein
MVLDTLAQVDTGNELIRNKVFVARLTMEGLFALWWVNKIVTNAYSDKWKSFSKP